MGDQQVTGHPVHQRREGEVVRGVGKIKVKVVQDGLLVMK